jgi:S1-C subfamily serine protease
MRKFLLSLLMVLATSLPLAAQRSPISYLEKFTFKTFFEETLDGGNTRSQYGTAFCTPMSATSLLTAAHALPASGPVTVTDYQGVEHSVKVLLRDTKKDIGVLLLETEACKLNPLQWAKSNALIGTEVWLFGYGGAMEVGNLARGIISTRPLDGEFPGDQLAQLNALKGHSGGAVINGQGQVVGMLVGGFNLGGTMNVIVPVESLKKATK